MAKRDTHKRIRNWTPDRLPDLSGRTYLITGGNSGIGLEAARYLANAGGDVVIAARDAGKAARAMAELRKTARGDVHGLALDLADLSSVRASADEARARFGKLDALINNAGIMQTPESTTADGFELQFGVNHLGHFLYAGLLYDAVEKAGGRIVSVSSMAHRIGRMNFNDLMFAKGYTPTKAYGQSKLANLLFAQELHRRLMKAGSPVTAYACHPGYSDTRLQSTGPEGFLNGFYKVTNALLAQSATKGAIPTVLSAAGEEARPGAYYGPTGFMEARGPVGDARIAPHARRAKDARTLWERSEELVDFSWSSVLPG